MGLKVFLKNLFTEKKTTHVTDPYSDESMPAGLRAREFATFLAISYISAAFSLCEVRTFHDNKEIFGLVKSPGSTVLYCKKPGST